MTRAPYALVLFMGAFLLSASSTNTTPQVSFPYSMNSRTKAAIRAEASLRAGRVEGDCSGHFYDVGGSMSVEPWYWHPTLMANGAHYTPNHRVYISTRRSGRGLMSTSMHEAMHHHYPYWSEASVSSTTRNCMDASDPGSGNSGGGSGNSGNGNGSGGGGDCESGGYYSYTTGNCCDEVWIAGGVEICVTNT